KLGFINGSYKKPEAHSPILHQWKRCNAIVLSWIMNTVSKEIYNGIIYSTDAFTVWTDLRERFNKVNGSRIFSLHREITCTTQGNLSISAYYSKLKQLWDEYDSLVTLPSCGCQTAKAYVEHDQQHKLFQFLMGLNDSYSNIRSQILLMSSLPTLGQAYSLINQEESHL
ncbi:UBN2_3 domain-containing protein, partial [Cephalotus follicularis]